MARKPSIAIVGPGSLGRAFAESLRRAGYRIREVVAGESRASRAKAKELAAKTGARAATRKNAELDADIIWFCVPDREIGRAALNLGAVTTWKGKVALHSSGVLGSDELEVLHARGEAVASAHPLMTFVSGSQPTLAGVAFAIEGDPSAIRVVRAIVVALKGEAFSISKQKKAAYHAWGAFISPLLVAALATAEEVARAAGIDRTTARRRAQPILGQTLRNYAALGPAGAFSGPLRRGDVATIAKHLQVLSKIPGAREVYMVLARVALRHLPAKNVALLKKTLRR